MSETKLCEQCHDEKDMNLFRKVTNQYTGVHLMSICKECYNSNNEERKRKQEEEWQRGAEARKQQLAYQKQQEEQEAERAARKAEERALTGSNPTEVTNHAWIHAFRKQGTYPESTERSGKWLIFLSPEVIDRYWQKVKAAVEQGQLGEQAKVSTQSPASMPAEVRRKKEERGDTRFVVCVYTYDYQDRGDVMRIRQVLRELGIKYPIRYKADAATRTGSYGKDYQPIYEA